jgi:hypothetical protein
VYDPPMTFTIILDRWVDNTGCPTKSSTKGGHPILEAHHKILHLSACSSQMFTCFLSDCCNLLKLSVTKML